MKTSNVPSANTCNKTPAGRRNAYYLKINREHERNLAIFWHWVKIVETAGADCFILADRESVKKRIVQLYVEKGYPEPDNFLKSKREELHDVCEGLYSEHRLNMAYAHLTPFIHAKENDYDGFWGIDADDTLLCASPRHCSRLLDEAGRYAVDNALNLFSLDMWYSRFSPDYHWTFGVAFTNMNADYMRILQEGKRLLGGKAISEMPKMVCDQNIDNYFSFLSHRGKLRCKTFCCEGLLFEHYGLYVIKYENDKIRYFMDGIGMREHQICNDVVKFDLTSAGMRSSLKIRSEIHGCPETVLDNDYAVCRILGKRYFGADDRKNIVLFGCGADGRRTLTVLQTAGIRVCRFCDSDARLWGAKIGGVEVISPQELQAMRDKTVIITSGKYRDEIEAQLIEMGITALNAWNKH
jgi:hypothetical protein